MKTSVASSALKKSIKNPSKPSHVRQSPASRLNESKRKDLTSGKTATKSLLSSAIKPKEPKLFDIFMKHKDVLNEIILDGGKKGCVKTGKESLKKIEEKLNEISDLKDCTVEEKSEGAFDGFVIKGKGGEHIFVKKDYNALETTMLASKILYNMGLGPKVAFVPAKEGHFIVSKDLNYTRNGGRKFTEGKVDILKKNPKENLQMYYISKILHISDISNNVNSGIVEKRGIAKGKIFDFLPISVEGESNSYLGTSKYYIDQFDAGKSGTITQKEFMKDVKLDIKGNFMNKESRNSIAPKASFETVVEKSFENVAKELTECGTTDNLKTLQEYKNNILERGRAALEIISKTHSHAN